MSLNGEAHQKITTAHLSRLAYLYVRQSTLRQVFENTESTQRQYALRERAVALGWPLDRIVVIDSDLGQSGASASDREGFQRLVTEVSLGASGSYLAWRCRALRATTPIGIVCSNFVRFPIRSSLMRMGCTIRHTSMTDCSWG